MKILLICGSIATKSHTNALLHFIQTLIKNKGVETSFWDLKKNPLPIALPEYHKHPWDNPSKTVKEFVRLVKNVDGFVLGSPLYHGSYSGVLKNALDNLHYDAFLNKAAALVSNSSSIRNCAHPCEHLRLVVRALYGYVLQSQIGTANSDYEEAKEGYLLQEPEIKERCERMVDELVKMTSLLKENVVITD